MIIYIYVSVHVQREMMGEVGESKRSGRWQGGGKKKKWDGAAQCRWLFRLYRKAKWIER